MNLLRHVFALSLFALLFCCCLDNVSSDPVTKAPNAVNRGQYNPQKENNRGAVNRGQYSPQKDNNRGRYNPQKESNSGRYNPQLHDPTFYNSYKSKYPEYYKNRQFYDNFFKKYNPRVVAAMAKILAKKVDAPKPDGVYEFMYETENGIHAEERGAPIKVGTNDPYEYVAGTFSFLTPEGVRVTIKYAADDKGYHPIITYDGVNADRYARQPQPAGVIINKVF